MCQFVIGTRSPISAVSSYRAQVSTFISLMETYRDKGSDAPFLKFLGSPLAPRFNAFALVYASVHTTTMSSYSAGEAIADHISYKVVRAHALRSASNVSREFTQTLGLESDDVSRIAGLHDEFIHDPAESPENFQV